MQVTLVEEMVAEQATAVAKAQHPKPWLQPHAGSWFEHPWGASGGGGEEATLKQLREWTLAQVRGWRTCTGGILV